MGSNEEYLDRLLRQVNGEVIEEENDGEASEKLADMLDALPDDTDFSQLYPDEGESEEQEFPELAKLFEDEASDVEEPVAEPELMTMENMSVTEESQPIEELPIDEVPIKEPPVEEMADLQAAGTEVPEPSLNLEEADSMDIADLDALMSVDSSGGEPDGLTQDLDLLKDTDVSDLIEALDGDDDDLAEISELLKKPESEGKAEDSDSSSLEEKSMAVAAKEEQAVSGDSEESSEVGEEVSTKKKKERKKREKKDASEKGKGLFQRIIAFFTDEEEEETEVQEKVQLDLSQENMAILEELDQGRVAPPANDKKSKKEKKPKQKKEKKPKKEKKQKPKKEKKPKVKKEKKPKEPKEPQKPLKPIGMKKIVLAFFFALTVFGMIMLFTSYIPDYLERQESRKAFEEGDYQKVYDLLITKEVSEQEEASLEGATLCLEMDRKLQSYDNYKKLTGREVEQLHALISGVDKYFKIQAKSEQYGVSTYVTSRYLDILTILQDVYGISEEEAKNIAAITDSVTYTKELKRILGIEGESEEDPLDTDVPESADDVEDMEELETEDMEDSENMDGIGNADDITDTEDMEGDGNTDENVDDTVNADNVEEDDQVEDADHSVNVGDTQDSGDTENTEE